jgi:hypothetical protein
MLSPMPDNPPGPATAEPCPRCQKPLVDPRGLGWCRACGYCKSLAEDTAKAPAAVAAAQQSGAAPKENAVQVVWKNTPVWAYVLILGAVAIVLGTYFGARHVPLTPLKRALWTTLQIASGVTILLVTQFVAVLFIAPEDATISFKDVVIPARLYHLIGKRLPRMAWALCLAVWSLTLVASAVTCVGGLGHWMEYLPKSQQQKTWH